MKVYYMTVFSILLMILFYVAGFDTTSSFVVERLNILDIQNLSSASFWIILVGLFGAVGVGSAIIGTFTNVSPQYILKSTMILPVLALLIFDLISILGYVSGWVYWVMLLLIAPLVGGWVIALIEFWEARD